MQSCFSLAKFCWIYPSYGQSAASTSGKDMHREWRMEQGIQDAWAARFIDE